MLHLHQLSRLYLAHNRIERLEGFSPDDSSPHHDPSMSSSLPFTLPLTELHMAHQDLTPSSAGLTFSPASLLALPRLTFLDVSHTSLADEAFASLSLLPSLTTLLGTSNPLHSLPSLLRVLSHLSSLSVLDLRHCPVTRERRYRDGVIAAVPRLTELDRRDVRGGERVYIREIEKRRSNPRAMRPGEAQEQISGPESGEGWGEGRKAGSGSRPDSGQGELDEVAVVGVSTGHSRQGSRASESTSAERRRQSWSKDGGAFSATHSRTSSMTRGWRQ